jgi:chromosome segregation ATPase
MSRKRGIAAIDIGDSLRKKTLIAHPEQQKMIEETDYGPSPSFRRFRHHDVLTCEVETLKAELHHERSLRALDAKRYVQEKHRLQQQLDFAMEETRDVQVLMKETLQKHDRYVEQLKKARLQTQEELRNVQNALVEETTKATEKTLKVDPRVQTLQQQVQAKSKEIASLKGVIATLQDELGRYLERDPIRSAAPDITTSQHVTVSEARPDVMQELSRVRILLSESERKHRQYHRAVEEVAQTSKQTYRTVTGRPWTRNQNNGNNSCRITKSPK